MFERRRLQTERLPEDLHYRLRDADTGEVVGSAAPVAVGEAGRASGFKRFLRAIPQPMGDPPTVSRHVPRVTLRVADARGATALFVDRAPKILDHPYPAQHAFLDARGTVLGTLAVADFALAFTGRPVDADGMTVLDERARLRGPDGTVLAATSTRLPMTEQARKALERPDCELGRLTGADGAPWVVTVGVEGVCEFSPALPTSLRVLAVASMFASRLDERFGGLLDHEAGTPARREPETEPFPGYRSLHDSHVREQEEWVAKYRKERNRLRRATQAAG